jgi:hypothetical protein
MRSPLERSRGHYVRTQARQLVTECESFLAGEYPSVLQRRGLPIPEWAWLSILAHAPADLLIEHAHGESRGRFRGHVHGVWLGAVALLAQELVTAADRTGCSVEELQHEVMLKVELDWVRPDGGASSIGPSRFVEQVRRALHRFRGSSCPQ